MAQHQEADEEESCSSTDRSLDDIYSMLNQLEENSASGQREDAKVPSPSSKEAKNEKAEESCALEDRHTESGKEQSSIDPDELDMIIEQAQHENQIYEKINLAKVDNDHSI